MSGSVSGGTTVGSGSDSIVLSMSGDSAAGANAQFTVNVDGQQIGGVQTVGASHGAGQQQTFTFLGNYGVGQHDVTVTFANNFLMPEERAYGDRNLYIESVRYNGQTVSNSTTPIYESPLFPPNSDHDIFGNATFSVNDTTPSSGGNNSTTPGSVSVGSGSDTVVLSMAEDEYQGDAQFTIKVDGVQVGGTQTTTAHLNEGQQQQFDVHGNWGSGSHDVTVTYVNDKIGDFYPGTQLAIDTTDRNLYVMGVKLNGGAGASGTPWELDTNGSRSFSVTAGSGGGGSNGGNSSNSGNSSGGDNASNNGGSGSDGSQNSDNASINSSSLSNGSSDNSSKMSFVAPNSDSSSNSGSGDNSGSSDKDWWNSDQSTDDNTNSGGLSSNDWTAPATSNSGGNDDGGNRNHGGQWSGYTGNGDWHAKWMAAHG